MDNFSVGSWLFSTHSDTAKFIRDKLDSILVSAELLGFETLIEYTNITKEIVHLNVYNRSKKLVFVLKFYYTNYNKLEDIAIRYINSNGEFTWRSSHERSIKYVLNKAEYLLRKSDITG